MGDDGRAAEASIDGELDGIYGRLSRPERIPRATYRVQLHAGFPFAAAAALAGYLEALGISDLYASPIFRARPGSLHGYDLVDHGEISPELGGEAGLDVLSAALGEHGLGLILDLVPNHVGVGGSDNAWWMEVLEDGPASRRAACFDIDWAPPCPGLEGKVLLPILPAPYGDVLESGALRLVRVGGSLSLAFGDARLPLHPPSYSLVLEPAAASMDGADEERAELEALARSFRRLPLVSASAGAKHALKARLEALCARSAAASAAVDRALDRLTGYPGAGGTADDLHALLERQRWRLAWFKVAAEGLNYRRFFDVAELAAVRMERAEVFVEAHRLVLRLVAEGRVSGLRVDHPDGLWDPIGYFRRLQRAGFEARLLRERARRSPADDEALLLRFDGDASARPLWIVAEKILARGEELPASFAVSGTSGYDFGASVAQLFVDRDAERSISETFARFTGRALDFGALVREKKRVVLATSLRGELSALSRSLGALAERDRRWRDFTPSVLEATLREVLCAFPVYRTYAREDSRALDARDRASVLLGVSLAARDGTGADPEAARMLFDLLTLRAPAPDDGLARRFVMRFQQLTGPVMAKGLEDTAFYVFNRLVSLNEVGGEPERFGARPADFHADNRARLQGAPASLLATSTHDTKRSEDVRARISVLSEVPLLWDATLEQARASLEDARAQRARDFGVVPDRNDELLFHQTVIGTWPGAAQLGAPTYVSRLAAYLRKATKEGKEHTAWVDGSPEYDAAVQAFVHGALASAEYARALEPLAELCGFHGRFASLSQVLLKLTSPGVPDFHQGTEVWDDSLVDPDNRRPVDFGLRRAMLAGLLERERASASGDSSRVDLARELTASAADGRIKLWVTRVGLDARRRHPGLFGEKGSYSPLHAEGARSEHLVAFLRGVEAEEAITVVPRLTAKLAGGAFVAPLGSIWSTTTLELPLGPRRDAFTGRVFAGGGATPVAEILADFPVALLERCERG